MMKSEDEAWDLFENLSENSLQHAQSSRVANPGTRNGGIFETNPTVELSNKVDTLVRQMSQLIARGVPSPYTQAPPQSEACAMCLNIGHHESECPSYPDPSLEQANAIQQSYNPYANAPNPSQQRPQYQNYNNRISPPFQNQQYQNQSPVQQRGSAFEEKVLSALSSVEQLASNFVGMQQLVNTHSQAIARLETQVGQIATTLSEREKGKHPSQPVENPKGVHQVGVTPSNGVHYAQVSAITTLRSGKIVDNGIGREKEKELVEEESEPLDDASPPLPEEEQFIPPPPPSLSENVPYEPNAPYPQALHGPSPFKKGAKVEDLMEMFKQVKINIPLLDAIKQIPAYAKFLKDLCTQKRKTQKRVPKRILLTEQVSSIIQNTAPQKFKDPGTPTIPCVIGDHAIKRALLDLGAGVNLMPYAVYEQLDLGKLQPTRVTLQLADRSIRVPRGVVEDVLVKVDKFVYPVDFVVLDMEEAPSPTTNIPIILGRPFLATSNAKINCRTGVMKISFGNLKARLNVFHILDNPSRRETCSLVDVYDEPKVLGVKEKMRESCVGNGRVLFDPG